MIEFEGTTLWVVVVCVAAAVVVALVLVACKCGVCSPKYAQAPQQPQQHKRRKVDPAQLEEGGHREMAPLRQASDMSPTSSAAREESSSGRERSPEPSESRDDSARSGLHRSDLSSGAFQKLTASTRKLLEDAEAEFGSFDPSSLTQEEAIGHGAQAVVYAGTLHDKDYRGQTTRVAIKVYSGLALSNKQMTRDLMTELNALKRLNRFKHILHFYGIVIDDNELKTVLEWCQGTIDQMTQGYPLHRKLHLLAQAASAINYLHSQQPPVMHGDIKPENILISEDFQVRVADFATSRILDSARISASDSRMRGTPVYMPPEAFNSKAIGLEGDIYAFAVTAWEVLTEGKAWHGLKMGRIMMAVSEGQRPEVHTLPAQVQTLLVKAWAQERHDRCSAGSLWTESLKLAILSALDDAILLKGKSGGLRLLQLTGSDDPSASAAEQCILMSVEGAVAQRGVKPDVSKFLSSLLGFFSGDHEATIDRSSQMKSALSELFSIVVV